MPIVLRLLVNRGRLRPIGSCVRLCLDMIVLSSALRIGDATYGGARERADQRAAGGMPRIRDCGADQRAGHCADGYTGSGGGPPATTCTR